MRVLILVIELIPGLLGCSLGFYFEMGVFSNFYYLYFDVNSDFAFHSDSDFDS